MAILSRSTQVDEMICFYPQVTNTIETKPKPETLAIHNQRSKSQLLHWNQSKTGGACWNALSTQKEYWCHSSFRNLGSYTLSKMPACKSWIHQRSIPLDQSVRQDPSPGPKIPTRQHGQVDEVLRDQLVAGWFNPFRNRSGKVWDYGALFSKFRFMVQCP